MRLDAGEFACSTTKRRGAPAHGTAGTAKKRKEHRTVNDGVAEPEGRDAANQKAGKGAGKGLKPGCRPRANAFCDFFSPPVCLPRKSDARSYEVLHLSRKIISANLKI